MQAAKKDVTAEHLARTLRYLNDLPENVYTDNRRKTKELVDAGWRQCDSNGFFFNSTKDTKNYYVGLSLPTQDYGHVNVCRDGDRIEGFDSVPGESLRHLSDKLEELQVWLA